jgi:dimethylhistidine N-methyltransferase
MPTALKNGSKVSSRILRRADQTEPAHGRSRLALVLGPRAPMYSSVRYEYVDLQPTSGSFRNDVIAGLSAVRRALPPKYFYDARGSQLFDAICELPEYYPTRTELAMMRTSSAEIARKIGPDSAIVEYGSGSGQKTRLLIDAVAPVAYVAIDISAEQLQAAIATLSAEFTNVKMAAVCADYTQPVPLDALETLSRARRVIYFPGSTIGNFTTHEAQQFLVNARTVARSGGTMVVGVDLKKDPRALHAAYNDAQGVTAAFNLNMLVRINRELGGDFDLSSFEHYAYYNEAKGRIEMHIVSTRAQDVTVAGRVFRFAAGEKIHTENSYKYSVGEFQALARQAGFKPEHCWVDDEALFSIHYLIAP